LFSVHGVLASALWATGTAVRTVVPWWLAFLILTIAGERLELSRFLKPSPAAHRVFALILVAIGIGLVRGERSWGMPIFAGALLALALWLGKQDLARRNAAATELDLRYRDQVIARVP